MKFKLKLKNIPKYISFFSELRQYKRMEGAEDISSRDLYPVLDERTSTTAFDTHYFYQDIWAFRKILESKAASHVDVGSKVDYVGFLSTITRVTFIDIRPLITDLPNFEGKSGSILDMPYEDGSIHSLSCLHVAEHIGLGRYGDPLDPLGTVKSCRELQRVLAPGGSLYFGLPIGNPRVCFNAHRIHSTAQIMEYFSGLTLTEFSFVTDAGKFLQNVELSVAKDAKYGCGLFQFTK
ncbi:MAG: class I SAM-dependent methyltransferase [Pseudomonadota bacterium]